MFKLLREIRKLLKEIRDELKKSNEPVRFVEEPFKRSFIGNDITRRKEIQNRKSFADKIKHTKKDIRKIAKKGIYYRDKIYTFDGYEKYIGETVSFEVQESYLILTLEDNVFHATIQDI